MTTALAAGLLLLFVLVAPTWAADADHGRTPRAAAAPGSPADRPLTLNQGRVRILHQGQPIPAAAYCDYIVDAKFEQWPVRVRQFIRSGVKVHLINVGHLPTDYFDSPFWTDDGVHPEAEPDVPGSIASQARRILADQPDALFFVRTWVSPPLAWTKKNPGEVQTNEKGGQHRQATLASEKYLEGIARTLRNLVSFCESQPWGDRVVGYMPAPLGEGCLPLVIENFMFDVSPANEAGFRAWLRETYGSDAKLQEAWGDPQATLATAGVPRDSAWLEKRRTGTPTLGGKPVNPKSISSNSHAPRPGLFHWIEPANAAPEIDYCRFMRAAKIRWVRTMAQALKGRARELGKTRLVAFDVGKQPLMGWQIQQAFDGQGDGQSFPHLLPLSGSFDLAELFDDPSIDGLWTPADYHARTIGYAYEAEGPADSMVLRGKSFQLENDARSWVGQGGQDQGAWRDPIEAEAGLLRNEALSLSRGFQSYWCNVGSSYFQDDRLQEIVARLTPMIERTHARPHRQTPDAIAMIVDDTSPLYEDFTSGYQSLAVIWQRINGLARCGIPYRIHLLSDLKRDDFPPYKVYLFPNLFKVDDEVLALLRKRVLRNGNLAIFGPSTGITDGRVLTAAPASRLLGVTMELHPRTTTRHVVLQDTRSGSHPIVREAGAGEVYGDNLAYGPTVTPADRAVEHAGGTPLGHANLCWFIHRTGLFVKESGLGAAGNGRPGPRGENDYAVLWSAAVPLPHGLLRAAARWAGCNVWLEEPDVVYASDTFVSIHSVRSGSRTLRLPRPAKVTDAMTGKVLSEGQREIRLEIHAPETRVFWLD